MVWRMAGSRFSGAGSNLSHDSVERPPQPQERSANISVTDISTCDPRNFRAEYEFDLQQDIDHCTYVERVIGLTA
jgi:hypothetical protein